MDNKQQINRMKKYQEHLCRVLHKDMDFNTVAELWIQRYAKIWRDKHSAIQFQDLSINNHFQYRTIPISKNR